MTEMPNIIHDDARNNYSKVILQKRMLIQMVGSTVEDEKNFEDSQQSPKTMKTMGINPRDVGANFNKTLEQFQELTSVAQTVIKNNNRDALQEWRERQEAEKERLRYLDHTPQPPRRPPKRPSLRPAYQNVVFRGGLPIVSDKINLGNDNQMRSKPVVPPKPKFCNKSGKYVSGLANQKWKSMEDILETSRRPLTVASNNLSSGFNNLKASPNRTQQYKDNSELKGGQPASTEANSPGTPVYPAMPIRICSCKPPDNGIYAHCCPHRRFPTSIERQLQGSESRDLSGDQADRQLHNTGLKRSCSLASVLASEDDLGTERRIEDDGDGDFISKSQRLSEVTRPTISDKSFSEGMRPKSKSFVINRLQTNRLRENEEFEKMRRQKVSLMERISTKLNLLRDDRESVREELDDNEKKGEQIVSEIEVDARIQDIDRIKRHMKEVDNMTSLMVKLTGRLARTEIELGLSRPEPEKDILLKRKAKLELQVNEAGAIQEACEKRESSLVQLLSSNFGEDIRSRFEAYLRIKRELVSELREIEDKIQLGEEQLASLSLFK